MAAPEAVRGPQQGAADAAAVVAAVRERFPGREEQVAALAQELTRSGALGGNCLVYGAQATGKTAVVRALLQGLRLRHAYVNCHESSRARPLLCSLLHQLKGGKRQRDEGYECTAKCDSIADFRLQLPGVVGRGRRSAEGCWLVLDHADRLAGTDLLAALLRAREDTGAELGVLLLGGAGWGSGRYLRDTALAPPPKEIHFPPYRPDVLEGILAQRWVRSHGEGEAPALRQFLKLFVPAFCRASNNLLDLQTAVGQLFPLYMRPLREEEQLQPMQLYKRIKEQVQQCIQGLQLQQDGGGDRGAGRAAPDTAAADDAAAASTAAARRACSWGLSFELPYVSKFLLLAAYIASRNKPTTDRAVFDPGFRKRGRRDAQAMDRQAEAAVEAKLRGPHSFPLERLLHIFYAIFAHHDAEEEEEQEEDGGAGGEARRVMQQAEVLQQVSSLVSLRLLEGCSGDVLEGQLYRCNLGEDMAHAIAANVRLRLADYLRLG